MEVCSEILFYVNGARRTISREVALSPLLTYLRTKERLTGAKLGCGEGGCGACTILLSTFDHSNKRIVHRAINSCLVPLAAVDGCAVTTIEAVGDRRGGLAPVQTALINMHGSQCGFCTPGIVMSMFALLRQRAAEGREVTEEEVEGNFDGNLCRCTGYRPILDAFKGLVRHNTDSCSEPCVLGEQCCRKKLERVEDAGDTKRTDSCGNRNETVPVAHVKTDRELIFPPELVTYIPRELNLAGGRWLRPVSLERFIRLRVENPHATIIAGNTELGVEAKFKGLKIEALLCVTHIPELLKIAETDNGLRIGASVTWTKLNAYIDTMLTAGMADDRKKFEGFRYGSLQAIQLQLRWFAGKQIRNMAAVSGNIVTASPISDVNPIWVAAGAHFILLNCRTGKERQVPARNFFLSYRKVDMSDDEIFFSVLVPWNESPYDITHSFKTSRRREDDIAIVSAGIRMRLEPEPVGDSIRYDSDKNEIQFRIAAIAIACGGLAPKTIAMEETEECLRGQLFNEKTMELGLSVLTETAKLSKDVPGGMPEFRQSLAVSFLFKAFVLTASKIDEHCISNNIYSMPFSISGLGLEADREYFAAFNDHSVTSGIQISDDRPPQFPGDFTGKSVKHRSAALQVSGEATFLDDVMPLQGELQAALVMSTEPHAKLLSVDYEHAAQMPGVYRVVTVNDLKGSNIFGPTLQDELCFAEDVVTTVGQVIGIVVADTLDQAKEAAKAVHISYASRPSILTIEDAIAANSFAPGVPERVIRKGCAAEVLQYAAENDRVVQGTVRIGAQEHWYLEPQGTIAIPEENGEMTILSSTQNASKTQQVVAKVLGEPMHKILCKVKRLGGGFGGKETRSLFISAAVAVAAQVSERPVRLILDRDTDMLVTGTRHAFLARYKAAFEPSGRIVALELRIFNNMGNCSDLTIPVLDRALYHAVNCYDIANVDLVGRACLTHTASATAFRGFGGPQGMMIAENVIEHVAWAAKMSPTAVRELNLYGKRDNSSTTHFGMSFNEKPLLSCWDGVLSDSSFEMRRKEADAFNESNKFRKRGIAVVPTMFGISFTFRTYNQAGALVHIFHGDGSVLISHGGVEMGQGLHTKICQVAATELRIPLENVYISETATDKVPNASPSAASSCSDLYGMAVKRACEQLNENLKPSKAKLGSDASWEQLVEHAYFNRISLSATGFYKTPELDAVNLGESGASGRPFFYFTNGAAVSEVEIDALTGESRVLRTDIVMDVGRPLNPALDVGQIEGGFIQGLGWCTMEEVVRGSSKEHRWVKEGQLFTLGPGTYKIPGFGDIPKDLRVRVLNTNNEQDTIHSSKAIGEPPLFLAASVFFAFRDAIRACRLDRGWSDWFELDSPATVERIRMTAAVHPSKSIPIEKHFRADLSL